MVNIFLGSLILLLSIEFSSSDEVNINECATTGATPRPTISPEYCQDVDPSACALLFPLAGDKIKDNLDV